MRAHARIRNVNGIRNPFSYPPWNTVRTFPAMFDILGSDIVVMQELKIQRKDLRDDMVLLDGWDCYFSLPRHKKGYSGVAVYTRNASCAPIKAEEGLLGVLPSPSGLPYRQLPPEECIGGYPADSQLADLEVDLAALDAEGRCVVLEFPAFVLLGVYSPANSNGLRDDYRHAFIRVLDCRVRNLTMAGKRVVLVGDLNVSRDEIDSASAAEGIKKSGITREDFISTPNRRIFNQMIIDGEVIGERDAGRDVGVLWDTTRGFHPDRRGMYTHWEQKINARPGNFGGRIDYVLVAECMRSWIQDANIQEGLLGSDHCPVFVDFHHNVDIDGQVCRLSDVMRSAGGSKRDAAQVEWKLAETPLLSARRLPEFDKRRSIKSMFAVPSAQVQSSPTQPPASPLPADTILPAKPLLDHVETGDSRERPPRPDNNNPNSRKQSALKRKAPVEMERSAKQSKPNSFAAKKKGQQTLKGFFNSESADETNSSSTSARKRAPTGQREDKPNERPTKNSAESDTTGPASPQRAVKDEPQELTEYCRSQSGSISPTPSMVESQMAVVEETQRSWGSLFARPVAPLCEDHNEPCKTMLTKKKGTNQGRSFWMCARPLGPSGNKEHGTQWRCPTFIWCSDWDGRKESA